MKKNKLTFGDIKVGELFIDFPTDGDNEGHGGLKTTYWVYKKRNHREAVRFFYTSKKETYIVSSFTEDMTVIKVG